MSQIEKPSAGATTEGFDELNSIFDAAKYTIILCGWGQQIKPSLLFIITPKAAVPACDSLAHLSTESAKGGQR